MLRLIVRHCSIVLEYPKAKPNRTERECNCRHSLFYVSEVFNINFLDKSAITETAFSLATAKPSHRRLCLCVLPVITILPFLQKLTTFDSQLNFFAPGKQKVRMYILLARACWRCAKKIYTGNSP